MTSSVAFIFARGGSKGLPDKNILEIAGKPLIAWSILHAKSCTRIERLIVSTDSNEIAEIAREYGAEVPFMRPKELASDTASEIESWRHALRHLEEVDGAMPDHMVSLPATSPLRITDDIDRAIDRYLKGDVDLVIGITPANRNPFFNMVKFDEYDLVHVVNKGNRQILRRQDAPTVFDITTIVYVTNSNYVMNCSTLFSGNVGAIEIPQERSIDIDTAYDFKIASFLMTDLSS